MKKKQHSLSKDKSHRDVRIVVVFCLIGFLLTLILIFRFPNIGAVIAEYNQF
jgi:hypothetical protein